ncbi:hypothetical protein QGX21_gp120 [Pseudomonas phage phiPsa315]|uniref:Uncharacterized protein n=1 Tax=Pseudomonas phage phiPsa315 TaxID=1460363 RepID=A0A7G9V234_9CAUD|nr:hypothetical protein QGX21_gp120 [Pseudomonas phage phiPsa315]QNO00340.1 hypothetical protein phiPsa315_106 [Pseudomonas phage phiPsa315]
MIDYTDFKVGDHVRIVGVYEAESLEHFTGQMGVVAEIYPHVAAPFPIYVTFDEDNVKVPFAIKEVELV